MFKQRKKLILKTANLLSTSNLTQFLGSLPGPFLEGSTIRTQKSGKKTRNWGFPGCHNRFILADILQP